MFILWIKNELLLIVILSGNKEQFSGLVLDMNLYTLPVYTCPSFLPPPQLEGNLEYGGGNLEASKISFCISRKTYVVVDDAKRESVSSSETAKATENSA